MKVAIPLLLSLALFVPSAGAQRLERSDDAEYARKFREANAAIQKARTAFAKKDYPKAKQEASAVLAKMPEFSEANFIVAKVLYIEKDYPAALESMEKAKSTFATSAHLVKKLEDERLVDVKRRRQQVDETITALSAEMSRLSADAQAQQRTKIEQAQRLRQDLDNIIATSMSNVPVEPPAAYFFIHGNILLRMNRAEEAVQQYQEALRLEPGYGEAANNLASLLYGARQYQKALEVLERAEAKGGTINPELKKAVLQGLGRQ